MVFRVERAKPIEMKLDSVIICYVHIRKGSARVDEGDRLRVSFSHKMVVHPNATERYLKVLVTINHVNPSHVASILRVSQVPCLVISANLKVASIFAKAQ